MFRNLFTVFLAAAVTFFGTEPALIAQYGPQPPSYQQPQPYPPVSPEQQDPNGQDIAADRQHGVARISIVQGDVNVKRADSGELVAAVINAPLVAQDHLQTAPGSRAEVELDSANLIRLGPNTDVGVADLEYRRYRVQLGMGTIIYRVLRASDAETEIDTPSIAIKPEAQGEIRISVLDDGTTEITLRNGAAEIFSPRGSQRLQPGQSILVRGNPSDPEFQNVAPSGRDQLDDWSATRDRDLLGSQSYQYVSPDVYGADDLDHYGNWVPSQYGQVWAPQAPAADWSPYSYGEWSWEPYYGWTWVDSAPWGWAPYHYGRWFWNTGYGWCWWPGARIGFHVWSPALVGFFGWGAGLGWVALAPYETFHPWWGRGWRGGYDYRGFGRTGFGLEHAYRNAAIRGGALTAPYNGFGGPHQRFAAATRAQLSSATLFRGQVPVSPTRASYQFSSRPAQANPRLSAVGNRSFFRPQGFANGSRFSATPQARQAVAPNVQRGYTGRGSYSTPSQSSSGGWQRFGEPGTSNSLRQNFSSGQGESGWHRFGQPQPQSASPQGTPRYPSYRNYGQQYGGGRSTYNAPRYSAPATPRYNAPPATPRYNAPSAPHYSAPAAPHYSAPARGSGGGGSSRGGGGGGGHSSGHRGR